MDIRFPQRFVGLCNNAPVFYRKGVCVFDDKSDDFDYDHGALNGAGWDADFECYCYDGFLCFAADDTENAETEYWNTH